jgi:5'-nucleotidase
MVSPHSAFVLGGDTISPSVASKVFKGAQMIAVWNALGLDYAVFGNHEFDFGDQVLRDRMKESRFKWLAANVVEKRTGKPFFNAAPYVIQNLGGVKVGFIGLLTPDTKEASKPGPEVVFLDPFVTARKYVPEMRKKGAQIIVAVTHMTIHDDKRLAEAVPIDVICGGHEHVVLESFVGRTPIFKVASDAVNLGRIDLYYSTSKKKLESIDWQLIPVTAEIPDDPKVAAIVKGYEEKLSAELDKPVGRTTVDLDARTDMNRTRETNIGNFVADAYRDYAKADVALTNGGSIRSNAIREAGPLTRKDVLTIIPFENPVVKVEVSGAVLRKALEHGLARAGDVDNGAYPQVSGVKFSYDARRPVGSRLVEVSVNGQPLDDTRTYTLATNTYVLGGGDGYNMFAKNVKFVIKPEEAQVEPAVVINAIMAVPEIAPKVEGRSTRIDAP